MKLSKNSMKHRLQLRFVLLSVAALLILQSLIVAFSIGRNYQQITVKADRIIKLISTSPDSSEIADARYFSVKYNPQNKSFQADLAHTSVVSQSLAADYAKKVIGDKTDKGYIDNYRYLVRREKDGIYITFLSRAVALESFRSNSVTLIIFSSVGIAVMIVILIAVSGKVVEPIVKNRQKQKEFITSASHELKTPLTVISADAQLLESDIGENEWLSDIIKQTKSMTEMTHRLVYLARAEEQEENFVKIDFPISDLAEDVAQSYCAVAQNCGKAYEVNIGRGISYCGDEKEIREMMTALLDNAFKYSTADGVVTVNLAAEGHTVRFSVENTVSQIDSGQLENFTERFYRKDTSDKVKGFGIGLSIARAVAEAHKGKLTVELPKENVIRITAVLK
ncbi:MAG: sensor histidine kinase [Oscillospiraceae bacterium]